MRSHIVIALVAAASIVMATSHANAQNRRTSVAVMNQSGTPISEISVRHKYSNDYKDKGVLKDQLKHGQTSVLMDAEKTKEPVSIRFNLGFLRTGADWWLATWKDANGTEYVTAPKNARQIVDSLEKLLLGAKPLATASLPATGIGGAAGGLAIDFLADSIFNTEATYDPALKVGFKQYILREPASKQRVLIIIGPYDKEKNEGTFRIGLQSKQGKFTFGESTGYKALTPGELDQLDKLQQKALEEAERRALAELKRVKDEMERRKKEKDAKK